jgi:hypothetical protein
MSYKSLKLAIRCLKIGFKMQFYVSGYLESDDVTSNIPAFSEVIVYSNDPSLQINSFESFLMSKEVSFSIEFNDSNEERLIIARKHTSKFAECWIEVMAEVLSFLNRTFDDSKADKHSSTYGKYLSTYDKVLRGKEYIAKYVAQKQYVYVYSESTREITGTQAIVERKGDNAVYVNIDGKLYPVGDGSSCVVYFLDVLSALKHKESEINDLQVEYEQEIAKYRQLQRGLKREYDEVQKQIIQYAQSQQDITDQSKDSIITNSYPTEYCDGCRKQVTDREKAECELCTFRGFS